ncbi:unnamed protein product, partial [Phaeothamnion confervicola]
DAATTKEEEPQQEAVLIYEGSLTAPIKLLKRVSITSCVISLVGMPAILVLANDSIPLSGQIAVAGTAMLAAVGSTALLHVVTKPYIHMMWELVERPLPTSSIDDAPKSSAAGSGGASEAADAVAGSSGNNRSFVVEQLDMLSRPRLREFRLLNVRPRPSSARPFVSFEADGQLFFVQGRSFADKPLLKQLLGRPLLEHEQ